MEDGGPCKVRHFSVGKAGDYGGLRGTTGDYGGLRRTTGDCGGLRGTAGDYRGLQGTTGDYRAPVISFLKRGTRLQGGPGHFIPWRTAGDGGGNGLWP